MKANFSAQPEKCTYLGFDLSTQKLKAVQLNSCLDVVATAEVQFDSDLPEFRTVNGAIAGPKKNEFFGQPVMWIKAVDIIMDRLVVNGGDLSSIAAIGGSAQQHGSVYWSRQGVEALRTLDPDKFLHMQIDDTAFVLNKTPIWMDGSTENQCSEMEMAIGGSKEMVRLTGSRCFPRFTGPQIRKVYQRHARAYEDTQRISLISSFLASIFIGDVAPIDYADGSGMNLFDIKAKTWSKACLNACAPDLEERLSAPVKTNSFIGTICDFFVQRFGMPANCKVCAFTGDNPSSLSGMLVEKDWLAVSLGTSDTVMMTLKQQALLEDAHVLCHPTEDNLFMGLLCFRNSSLVRDGMKHSEATDNWNTFNELLDSTPRGNYGNMALHFPTKEIVPSVKGTLRWNKDINAVSTTASTGILKFSSPQTEIRALIEGQMLHRLSVAVDMGFNFGGNTKIIATGGASVNKSILQVIADVFNAPVYVQKTSSEAALLGAAYRAGYMHYLERCKDNSPLSYNDFISPYILKYLTHMCQPSKDSNEIYTPMLERIRSMIQSLQKTN
uniref:Xylulose kinase n=1 Tax=Glossina morsitans morsitans TaxID=37546 RepID=A0A1B0FFP6_GLOMM